MLGRAIYTASVPCRLLCVLILSLPVRPSSAATASRVSVATMHKEHQDEHSTEQNPRPVAGEKLFQANHLHEPMCPILHTLSTTPLRIRLAQAECFLSG